MGLSNILGVLVAVVSVSALAADPPLSRGNVSVNLNPTTSYYTTTNSTLRLPSGVSVSPNTTVAPVVSRYPAGLQQTIPTGITIDAIKKSAPLPAVVRAKTQTVKNAAKGFLGSPRSNLAFLAASAGLQALLDGVDWIMNEGSAVQKKFIDYDWNMSSEFQGTSSTASTGFSQDIDPYPDRINTGISASGGRFYYCKDPLSSSRPSTFLQGAYYSGSTLMCAYLNNVRPDSGLSPVSQSDIDSVVDSSYNPDPTDWRSLTPYLHPDDIEITSAPTLQGEPETTTVYDADGNPHKVTTTNTWYDFAPKDNPSPQPALDMKIREETKTYEDGILTGTTTTESTASGGAGGPPAPELDIPTDCDFMPTVCAFLEWYRDDDEPEEPDLSVLIDDRDFTESYTISGGSKQCPPPYELALPFIGQTYYLSFDFACDFASKIYYFIMAAAYIFAAYITIGVARNG